MRAIFAVAVLLVAGPVAVAQKHSASATEPADVTVRVSAEGLCSFAKTIIPSGKLGEQLVSAHLVPNRHVHIDVTSSVSYEILNAALDSLSRAGITNVGFVRHDHS
jgi:biopolymer transport protein ExbD